jgi:hypothetical protein
MALAWHERSHKDLGHRWLRSKLQDCARDVAGG